MAANAHGVEALACGGDIEGQKNVIWVRNVRVWFEEKQKKTQNVISETKTSKLQTCVLFIFDFADTDFPTDIWLAMTLVELAEKRLREEVSERQEARHV